MSKALTAAIGAAIALFSFAMPAHAQLLTFVAATGADSRPCTVQTQPCRTLDRAIDATTAGGEIRFLSSLPNQAATIDKSLTVDGASHTMIGAITIDSASAVVTLRNLSLNGRNNNATGIDILNAAVVRIENCTVERYFNHGINLYDNFPTELFVTDSVSRDNDGAGLVVLGPTTAKLTVDNSRFENNAREGMVLEGGQASIARSVFSGNIDDGLSAGGVIAVVTDSVAAGNDDNGFSARDGGQLTLDACVGRGNFYGGVFVDATSTARISTSVFNQNDTGIRNDFGGTALSLGNNLIADNTTADVDGTLTALAAQ